MELTGDSVGALAAAREMEKAGVDESLRPLYDRIYALQDEQAATEAAAQALAAIADERGFSKRSSWRPWAIRSACARRLAALDPSNRAIQERIWQIEAQQAADEELNAHAKSVMDRQYDVTRLLTLQGIYERASCAQTLHADPVNRSILEQIYALTDLKDAQDAATQAAQEARRLRRPSRTSAMASKRSYSNVLLGDTATIRARELALLDPSNRALQERIWALTDAQAAEEARTKAIPGRRAG